MNRLRCCAAWLLALAALAAAVPADRDAFHLIVLMGQSNMAGSGVPVPTAYDEPLPRVLTLAPDGSWQPTRVPFTAGLGPGQVFARHYARLHPGATVGLIPCARGSRGIAELAKGGVDRDGARNYDVAVARIAAAMRQGTVKAVLWHQGETDAGDAGYVDRLAGLAADLRADLGLPEVPFIAGQLCRALEWYEGFNRRILRAAQAIPRCAVVGSEGLRDGGDKVHFSGFSVEALGARYLMAYLRLAEPALAERFAPDLAAATAAALARERAWDALINGDMAEGGAGPLGWGTIRTESGALEVARDPGEPAGSAPSLRLSARGGAAAGAVSQLLRDVEGRRVRVAVRARNAGFAALQVRLIGLDVFWKPVFERTVADASGAVAWQAFSGEADVPAEAVNTRLAIVVAGAGTAWIDDVAVERIGTAAPPPPAPLPAGNLLANGTMEAGSATADGWTATWAAAGTVAAARDTAVRAEGAASLRLDSVGGPAAGAVSQRIDAVAGHTVRVSGRARGDGRVAASVALMAFDHAWKPLARTGAWQAAPGSGTEWTDFAVVAEVPAAARRVQLSAGIDGAGSAWFDDLSVVAADP